MQPNSRAPILAAVQLSILLAGSCADPEPGTAPATEPKAGWFNDATERVGLSFVHDTGDRGAMYMPEISASGGALFDYDGDGDLDIYLANGSAELYGRQEERPPVNRMYRWDEGGRVTDVTEQSGLGDAGYGMGVAVGDVDNDGDPDVYLTNYGADRFYRNLGGGRFRDETTQAGIEVDSWSSSAVFLDYDVDGFLDLYVASYLIYDPDKDCFDTAGRADYCAPSVFPPEQDRLLRNRGDGTFEDVTRQAGLEQTTGAGLGVVAEDLDGDGRVDIYVANDGYPNQMWINRGDGTFEDRALALGAAFSFEGRPEAGMGVLAADLDNDGRVDLFMTHLARESNTAYRNLGPGRGFVDMTGAWDLATSSLNLTGFGTVAFDTELDGDQDLFVANGRVTRAPGWQPRPDAPPFAAYAEPNLFYVNDGTGTFRADHETAAAFTESIGASRGLLAGDLDADGDLDLVLSNAQAAARLFLNEAPRQGRWLQVLARDPDLKRPAIGARVELIGGGPILSRTATRGVSFQCSGPPTVHFGIPRDRQLERIEIVWPDGRRERFPVGELDARRVIDRGSGEPVP